MPKKRGKREPLTEEEKLLQMQQRAQAEEEMAKKKEEMLMLYLKEKLQKEQKNTAVNLLKLTESWRKVLRQTRDSELLAEAAVHQQTSDRRLEELNFIIQKMMRELQQGQSQADRVQSCHLQHVEYLWELQEKHLKGLHQRWESSLRALNAMCFNQEVKALDDFRQQNLGLVDLYLPAQMHDKAMSEYLQKVQHEVVDVYKNAHQDLDALRTEVKNQEDGSALNRDILQKTRNSLIELDQKIARQQQDISLELRNVKRLKSKAIKLRQQIFSCQAERDLMQQNWDFTTDKINQKCRQLQEQLARDRQDARKKLAILSIQGATATKNLQAIITKGEKVLRVSELCRKIKKQQEIMPGTSEDKQRTCTPEQEVLELQDLQQLKELQQLQEKQQLKELHDLQQLLNSTLLHREALRKQNQVLKHENQHLQALLDHRDDILDGGHTPLLALQPPVQSSRAAGDMHHNILEAAHVAKYLVDSWS
ncbi:PREDICTED: coiled-coil domain-containing protein 65-like [Poecilia mexicana]|uniref:coiled-coil domain-containing protein 65-like n=1 Tax=Poecilia mexicana TaxID=48701 RepID=UPI00072E82A7|nr:PREDICTED: coiled-coil domain-containing protein 65-like [Poecilia mexicana]